MMKKLYFGFLLVLSGTMIISAALIGGGAVASGRTYYSDIIDSDTASAFLVIGSLIFLIGLIISIKETFKK